MTVGTAGHIDHGKTSLVKYLTGHDTDTLPEEKERGITINLGFATFTLPDNRRIGIVDVPGHERFIHNMVAGATGIDMILLVIAADDGVMPQTVEHFHIARFLGITAGMIVITKTDLVDEARVAAVMDEALILVAGSQLEQAPIVAVSSKTGAGFDMFRETFVSLVDQVAQREAAGPFRMPVERTIVMKGLGVIVAGVPRSGSVRVGDSLELLPAGRSTRVKGIRFFDQDVESGQAGQLLALRVADLSHGEIKRGDVLTEQGYFTPSKLVNVRFQAIDALDKPVAPRSAVRFHTGTAEVTGYLVLVALAPLASGKESYAQFQLSEPVVAAPGDFFLARTLSSKKTIGGGTVVSCSDRRLRRRQNVWLDAVAEQDRARSDPALAITLALRAGTEEPLTIVELTRRTLLSGVAVRQHLFELMKSGVAIECPGSRYFSDRHLAAAREELLAVMNRLHDAAPLSIGFPKKDLMSTLKCHAHVTSKALESLLNDGTLTLNSAGYQVRSRAPALSPAKAMLAEKIARFYKERGFASPLAAELPKFLGLPANVIKPVFTFLVQTGELVLLNEDVVLHRDCLEDCRKRLVDYLALHGSIDVGAFKELIGVTRKYAIPMLEYWDANGLTFREGNVRRWKKE